MQCRISGKRRGALRARLQPALSQIAKLVLAGIIATSFALPVSLAAIEGRPTTKIECRNAGMKWDRKAEQYKPRSPGSISHSNLSLFEKPPSGRVMDLRVERPGYERPA
jgi:hypothetical protein